MDSSDGDRVGHGGPPAAYRSLRAVLHALRDRIGVNETAQLAAQLPMVLRGAFYEDWVPARVPATYRDREEFLSRIMREAGLAGETEASYAATAVIAVLSRHVSEGELEDVVRALPENLRTLFQPASR